MATSGYGGTGNSWIAHVLRRPPESAYFHVAIDTRSAGTAFPRPLESVRSTRVFIVSRTALATPAEAEATILPARPDRTATTIVVTARRLSLPEASQSAKWKSHTRIAEQLGVRPQTVATGLYLLRKRLGVRSTPDAVQWLDAHMPEWKDPGPT